MEVPVPVREEVPGADAPALERLRPPAAHVDDGGEDLGGGLIEDEGDAEISVVGHGVPSFERRSRPSCHEY
jgi:hypothetical protein